jgi:hypothetical protein
VAVAVVVVVVVVVVEEEEAVVLVEQVLVVPVEVLARAVLPDQAAAIRQQILQARPGAAAPILQEVIRTPEIWTPTPMG